MKYAIKVVSGDLYGLYYNRDLKSVSHHSIKQTFTIDELIEMDLKNRWFYNQIKIEEVSQ